MNVLIAGDFCDRYRISDLIARGNYASLFDDIKYLTEQADVSIINFEFPIVLHAGVPIPKAVPHYKGSPPQSMPSSMPVSMFAHSPTTTSSTKVQNAVLKPANCLKTPE